MSSRFGDWMLPSLTRLGLRADVDFSVEEDNAPLLVAPLRLRDIGGANGMLLFETFADVRSHVSAIQLKGYGFSVLSVPGDGAILKIDSMT